MAAALYGKRDFLYMARVRQGALVKIANALGKNHDITRLMGACSYGRSHFETGPDPSTWKAVESKAGLDGMAEVLKTWARLNGDEKAFKIITDNYPTNYTKAP